MEGGGWRGGGGSWIGRPESWRRVNEHAGARLENGGLASLALAQAGQGSATVRRRIKRGAEEGGLKVERGLRDRLQRWREGRASKKGKAARVTGSLVGVGPSA